MISIRAAVLVLCGVGACAAQTPKSISSTGTVKHFRMTFVLSYPNTQQPSQIFVLDVPVAPVRPGVAIMNIGAGPTGQVEGSFVRTIQCTDVHESATGLAANVSFTEDSVPLEDLQGASESRHRRLDFERKIDVALAKPTRITGELQVHRLGKGPVPQTLPPAPQITLTAVEM